jgi:hypothetical protein
MPERIAGGGGEDLVARMSEGYPGVSPRA